MANRKNFIFLKKIKIGTDKAREIKVKKKSLSSRLYQAYTKGNPGYLQMYLDGVSPSQISRESYYIGYYSQHQNDNIESIKKAYKEILAIKDFSGPDGISNFGAISLTQIPGDPDSIKSHKARGVLWTKPN